jgi:hypothetical protein
MYRTAKLLTSSDAKGNQVMPPSFAAQWLVDKLQR